MRTENYNVADVDPGRSRPGKECNRHGQLLRVWCIDCLTEDETELDFMVRDGLWWEAFGVLPSNAERGRPRGFLCLTCLKKRLGVEFFAPTDFPLMGSNVMAYAVIKKHYRQPKY